MTAPAVTDPIRDAVRAARERRQFADVSGGSSTSAGDPVLSAVKAARTRVVSRATFGPVAGTRQVAPQPVNDTGALGTLAQMVGQAMAPGEAISAVVTPLAQQAGKVMFSKEGLPRAVAAMGRIVTQTAEGGALAPPAIAGMARAALASRDPGYAAAHLEDDFGGATDPRVMATREAVRTILTDPMERALGVTPLSNRPDAAPYDMAMQFATPALVGAVGKALAGRARRVVTDATAAGLNRGLTTDGPPPPPPVRDVSPEVRFDPAKAAAVRLLEKQRVWDETGRAAFVRGEGPGFGGEVPRAMTSDGKPTAETVAALTPEPGAPRDQAAIQEGLFGERTLTGHEQTSLLPESAGVPTASLRGTKIAQDEMARLAAERPSTTPVGETPASLFDQPPEVTYTTKPRTRKPVAKQTREDLYHSLADQYATLQNPSLGSSMYIGESSYGEVHVGKAQGGIGIHILKQADLRAQEVIDELARRGEDHATVMRNLEGFEEARAERAGMATDAPGKGGYFRADKEVPFSLRSLSNERGALGVPNGERIDAIAERLPSGKIIIGKPGQVHGEITSILPDGVTSESGFITSKGRFVLRDEALRIAQSRGQAPTPAIESSVLGSEDIDLGGNIGQAIGEVEVPTAFRFPGIESRAVVASRGPGGKLRLTYFDGIGAGKVPTPTGHRVFDSVDDLVDAFKEPELRNAIPDNGAMGEYGAGALKYLTGLTGAGVGGAGGAAAGSQVGDTPEARRRNAIVGGILGAVGGGIVGVKAGQAVEGMNERGALGVPGKQTDTPEFKAWFGESKAVDESGAPRVVYHGTGSNFNKFSTKKTTQGIHWFTSDRAAIDAGEVGAQGKGRVMDLFASLKNPAGWKEYDKFSLGELRARGYDGAILPSGDGHYDGFVFEPTQLKSASKNTGAFDPSNADIRGTGAIPTLTGLTGAGVGGAGGAAAGSQMGDTPEEKRRNAIVGGILGAVGGGIVGVKGGQAIEGMNERGAAPIAPEAPPKTIADVKLRGEPLQGPLRKPEENTVVRLQLPEALSEQVRGIAREFTGPGYESWGQVKRKTQSLLKSGEIPIDFTRASRHEVLGAAALLRQNMDESGRIAARLADPKLTDVERAALEGQMTQLDQASRTLFNSITSAKTEQARDLAANRILANLTNTPEHWQYRAQKIADRPLSDVEGATIRKLLDTGKRDEALRYIGTLRPTTMQERLISAWKAMLLTNLRTHAANTASNVVFGMTEEIARNPAAFADWAATKLIGGDRTKTPTSLAILKASAEGAAKGLRQVPNRLRGLPTGRGLAEGVIPHEAQWGHPILTAFFNAPFRFLEAADAPFFESALRGSLAEQATILAKAEGAKGAAAAHRIAKLIEAPTDEMVGRALHDAAVRTYKDKTAVGDVLQSVQKAFPVAGNIVMPFTKTPGAVATRFAEYTPYGFAKSVRLYRQAVTEAIDGLPNPRLKQAAAETFGRATVGLAPIALGAALYRQGKASGQTDPGDKAGRDTRYLLGVPDDGFLLGGQWVEPNRLGPQGMLLSLGAVMAQQADKNEQTPLGAVGGAAFAGVRTVTDQPFLTGVQSLLQAREGADNAARYFANLSGSLVPSVVGAVEATGDPYLRDARTAGEKIQSRVPGQASAIPTRTDQLGQPARRFGPGAQNLFSPIRTSPDRVTGNPILEEIRATGAEISALGRKKDETAQAYQVRATVIGARVQQAITDLMAAPEYRALPPEQRKDVLEDRVRAVRSRAAKYPAGVTP